MDQKNLLTKALGLLQVQRQHRWWLRIVTGMAAVVVFVTTYLLILPAITMEHSTLEVTATPSEAVLGETIDTEIYAEAEDGREETFFVISADGDNAGLDESQFGFDEDGIAVIEDVGGQAIKLHREYDEDGVVCYWFTLSEGQSAQFTLPWINGVDRYRTEIVEEEVLIEIEEEMPDSLPTETETIPEEIAPGEEVSSEEATVESAEGAEPGVDDPMDSDTEESGQEQTPDISEEPSVEEPSPSDSMDEAEIVQPEEKPSVEEPEDRRQEPADDPLATDSNASFMAAKLSSPYHQNVRAIQAVGVAPVSLSRHNVSIVAQSYAVATDSNTSTEPIRDEKPDNSSASTSSSIDDDDDRTVQVERYTEIVLDQGGEPNQEGTLEITFGCGSDLNKALRNAQKREDSHLFLFWYTEDLLKMQAVNEQETISVGDKIYIAVPQTDVTVNGKTDAVSGAVNEELDVKIWFELGTTSDSRNHFYYKLPEGITVQDITNHPLLDGNGKQLGTYSYQEVDGEPYLLLDITEHSTSMSGQADFSASFSAEGTYQFDSGPSVQIYPEDIEKSKLALKKTASDAVQNEDGSWTWTFTITITNNSDNPMSGIILRDRMEISDLGIRLELGEVKAESTDSTAQPGIFGEPVLSENDTVMTAATNAMTIPAGASYTYTYTATLPKDGVDQAQSAAQSLSYQNTAFLSTEQGVWLREVSAQIAYVTPADVFHKDGTLPDDDNSYVEWTIALSTAGQYDASGSPIRDTLNEDAYNKGTLDYIKENSGEYQPYIIAYWNGHKGETVPLTWEEVDSLEDVSSLTDDTKLYWCENQFYWPGVEGEDGNTPNLGVELHYWTTYPGDFSQYGQNMNQAQSSFKGLPIGTVGEVYGIETTLNKALLDYRNDQTAQWELTLENKSASRQENAWIWDELPDQSASGSPRDTMKDLNSYASAGPDAVKSGNYFWVFSSVEELERVTGIRVTVTDTNGAPMDADEVLCRGADGVAPGYIGFGYYRWSAWKIYPNLYGITDDGKTFLQQAASSEMGASELWYSEQDDMYELTLLTNGSVGSYLPGVGVESSDFPLAEGYSIHLKYETHCAQDASLLETRRTNNAIYYGIASTGDRILLRADAAYYQTASQQLQPVQKWLGEVKALEDGSLKLTYLSLLDNRYRSLLSTKDQWVDTVSGVDGAYYVMDSLQIYRAQVEWDADNQRWLLDHVNSVSQLPEEDIIDWSDTIYPGFLHVEETENGFTLTLNYSEAEHYLYPAGADAVAFAKYAADFKNPDNVDYDTLDAATKASFYLCYDVVIPADELSELENDAVLRNTIRAYMDDELMGSSYTDYALDAMELNKSIKNSPIADNDYTVTFVLNVMMTDELKELGYFSLVDTLSDTLSLDVKSIAVYGVDEAGTEHELQDGYQAYVDDQTLTILFERQETNWAYERYRVTYDAKIIGTVGDRVDYHNSAVIPEISGTPQRVEESVFIQSASAGVDQARVDIYKYDGDDTRKALAGAKFELLPMDEEEQAEIIAYLQENGPISQEEFDQKIRELGEYEDCWDVTHGFEGTTDETGTLVFTGDGNKAIYANRIYLLRETESPDGYLLTEDGYAAFFLIYQMLTDAGGNVKTYLTPYVANSGMVVQYQVPNYKANFRVYKVSAYDTEEYLTGAEFTLYEDEACTSEISQGILTQDADGRPYYYFGGLSPDKTYYLKETKAPDGYVRKEQVYTVTVDEKGSVTFVLDGENVLSSDNTLTVANSPAVILPATGGPGNFLFTAGGLALLALAILMYKTLRRKECGAS